MKTDGGTKPAAKKLGRPKKTVAHELNKKAATDAQNVLDIIGLVVASKKLDAIAKVSLLKRLV